MELIEWKPSDVEAWVHKASAWATLVRQRANFPDHPLHESVYLPLFQWLIDNQPDNLGFRLEKTND